MFSRTFTRSAFLASSLLAVAACGGGYAQQGSPAAPTGTAGVDSGTAASSGAAGAAVDAGVSMTPADATAMVDAAIGNPSLPSAHSTLAQVSTTLQSPVVQQAMSAKAANASAACQAASATLQADLQKLEADAAADNDAAVQADAQKLLADLQTLLQTCL